MSADQPAVFTIGHSTRPLAAFLALLEEHAITHVVDVRTVPRSRRNPDYNREMLPDALEVHGIGYTHMPGLGGLRKPRADSVNMGWRNDSFRGFADYMQTPEFEESLAALVEVARRGTTAIMCAEAVPWRCQRSLSAEALIVRGWPVYDIIGPGRAQPHKLTPFAHAEGTRLTYPSDAGDQS